MNISMPCLGRVVICGLLLVCVGGAAHAQFRAAIQGTVKDTSGGVVSEATVTLSSKETNQKQEVTTSEDGFYRISGLAPGIGRLEVIEGAGHFIWVEAPGAVLATLRRLTAR